MQGQITLQDDITITLASVLTGRTYTDGVISFPALPPLGAIDHSMNDRKYHCKIINGIADNKLGEKRDIQVSDWDKSYRSLKSNLDTLHDAGPKTTLVSDDQFTHKPANDLDSSMLKKFDCWRTLNSRLPYKSGPLGSLMYDDARRQTQTDQGKFMPSIICHPGERMAESAAAARRELDGNCACSPLYRKLIGLEQQPGLLGKTSHSYLAHTATIFTQRTCDNTDSTNLYVDEADIPALWIDSPETRRHRRGSLSSAGTTSGSYRAKASGVLSPDCLPPLVDGIAHAPRNKPISPAHPPQSSLSPIPYQCQLDKRQHLSSLQNSPSEPGIICIQGLYICRCCPKKPNKFQTARELRAHMAQKRYECSHCGNRFKTKHEAARHEISLHIQRRSWSCSSLHLAGYDKAFHQSATHPDDADVCGYCGEEFFRSGNTGHLRLPTEQDWYDRLRHLHDVHRFIECNSSKKYFWPDHFRQHLKHSHAATTGKWSSMLIAACMMEMELPRPSTPKQSSKPPAIISVPYHTADNHARESCVGEWHGLQSTNSLCERK